MIFDNNQIKLKNEEHTSKNEEYDLIKCSLCNNYIEKLIDAAFSFGKTNHIRSFLSDR